MSSAAVVISSAFRFIYKQATFRSIFLIFRRKQVLTLHANFLQLETICMQFQITRPGKNKKYNKLSAVELACMQFDEKKIHSDQTLYSVSSAELAQKVVKVKFGQIQIHLNEVICGRDFTIVRLPIYIQLYAKQNQYYAWLTCLISQFEGKNQSFIYWKKYEKCFAVFPRISMYPSQS